MNNEKLISGLNKILADVQVFYVKLHNYHWNIKGKKFFEIHKATEGYYEYFAEQYDEVAERILQLDGKPYVSMKQYLNNAEIKEEEKTDFGPDEVVDSIESDFKVLLKGFKGVSELAGELNDAATANLADDNIAWLEKTLWMFKAYKG